MKLDTRDTQKFNKVSAQKLKLIYDMWNLREIFIVGSQHTENKSKKILDAISHAKSERQTKENIDTEQTGDIQLWSTN